VGKKGGKDLTLANTDGFARILVSAIQLQIVKEHKGYEATALEQDNVRSLSVRQISEQVFWNHVVVNMYTIMTALCDVDAVEGDEPK